MKTTNILAALVGMILFFTSCGSDDEPYIVFKYGDGTVINSAVVPVELGSELELYVDIGYEEARGEHNLIHYERRIDDGVLVDLAFTGTLKILSIGVFNNLNIERSRIRLDFSEERVSHGSQVMVIVRDNGSLRRTLVFEVE